MSSRRSFTHDPNRTPTQPRKATLKIAHAHLPNQRFASLGMIETQNEVKVWGAPERELFSLRGSFATSYCHPRQPLTARIERKHGTQEVSNDALENELCRERALKTFTFTRRFSSCCSLAFAKRFHLLLLFDNGGRWNRLLLAFVQKERNKW